MKKAFALALLFAAAPIACSLFTPANVKSALDASQLACVFASELTDAKALAAACAVDQALVPVIDKLIAQREGAKKAGVAWK